MSLKISVRHEWVHFRVQSGREQVRRTRGTTGPLPLVPMYVRSGNNQLSLSQKPKDFPTRFKGKLLSDYEQA